MNRSEQSCHALKWPAAEREQQQRRRRRCTCTCTATAHPEYARSVWRLRGRGVVRSIRRRSRRRICGRCRRRCCPCLTEAVAFATVQLVCVSHCTSLSGRRFQSVVAEMSSTCTKGIACITKIRYKVCPPEPKLFQEVSFAITRVWWAAEHRDLKQCRVHAAGAAAAAAAGGQSAAAAASAGASAAAAVAANGSSAPVSCWACK